MLVRFIFNYDIEYVKDMDLIKLHNMNNQEDEPDYDDDDVWKYGYSHYSLFPIMYFSIKRAELDIAMGFIGDYDRFDFSNIYLNYN